MGDDEDDDTQLRANSQVGQRRSGCDMSQQGARGAEQAYRNPIANSIDDRV